MGSAAGQNPQDQQALMMSMLGGGSPVPPTGFGQFGQEKTREMLRMLMAKSPLNPLPTGMPPTSISDLNKTLLSSYGQNASLNPPAKQPPASRPNVVPLSV